MKRWYSHYDYLKEHLFPFMEKVGVNVEWNGGIIGAHGDKAYGYRDEWREAGIPFPQGVAIYLLTYCRPYSQEVRETAKGWVDPWRWVIDNKDRFLPLLPPVPPEYED